MADESSTEKIQFKPPAWAIVVGLVFLVGYPIGMMARGFAPVLTGVFIGAAVLLLFAYAASWLVFRLSKRNNGAGGTTFGVLASLLVAMGVLNISDAMGFREARATALALQNRSGTVTSSSGTPQPDRRATKPSPDSSRQSRDAKHELRRTRTPESLPGSKTPAAPEPVQYPEWRALGTQFANDIALTVRSGEFSNRQDRQRLDRLDPPEAEIVRARIALREYIMPTNATRDEAWDAVGNGGIVVIADVVNQTDPNRIETMRENFRAWSRAATDSVKAYADRETIVALLGDADTAERAAFLEGLDEQVDALGLERKAEARTRASETAIAFIDFLEEHKGSIRVRNRRTSVTDPGLSTPMQEHAALVRSAMKRCVPWERIRR